MIFCCDRNRFDFGRLWRINMFRPFHRKSLLGPESMLLLCAWRGKRWHLSVFSVHFRNEAKTAVLQNAQNLNSLAGVTGSSPALTMHYLRDLSLVDTTLTPPSFVTSQRVVTCGYHGFKSRRICLWWTRIHLQPALWIGNQLSTFCWVFHAVVIIWFVTFYTQPLTQQQQQKNIFVEVLSMVEFWLRRTLSL